ncbi:MarR family transcriptional regulator [Anaerolentibacter hominis]|uniref:MarR family transcriptional regulator n=1 Tax=Anaerolentibacter hominis TaxID=3079009 RepID=UPI0031B87FB8
MKHDESALNHFLVDVFNEILKTEELCISNYGYKDLSIRELHVIEAVCIAEEKNSDNRATKIAAALNITAGTLTTTVSILERKGYLARFHKEMVDDILENLTGEETEVFIRALGGISSFFRKKYKKGMNHSEEVL